MKNSSMDIDEKTRISLWAVIASVPIMVGGLLWLTAIDAKATAAKEDLSGVKVMMERQFERLQSIDSRLNRIEGKLNQ